MSNYNPDLELRAIRASGQHLRQRAKADDDIVDLLKTPFALGMGCHSHSSGPNPILRRLREGQVARGLPGKED